MSVFELYSPFISEYIYSHGWEALGPVQVAAAQEIFCSCGQFFLFPRPAIDRRRCLGSQMLFKRADVKTIRIFLRFSGKVPEMQAFLPEPFPVETDGNIVFTKLFIKNFGIKQMHRFSPG